MVQRGRGWEKTEENRGWEIARESAQMPRPQVCGQREGLVTKAENKVVTEP